MIRHIQKFLCKEVLYKIKNTSVHQSLNNKLSFNARKLHFFEFHEEEFRLSAAEGDVYFFTVQQQQQSGAVTLHQISITNDNVTRPAQHRRSLQPRILASVR